MSDYCGDCWFDQRARRGSRACPFNVLYWKFVINHEADPRQNYRTARMAANLRHLDETERQRVHAQAAELRDKLAS